VADRSHRLHPEIFRILFALAWHTEWSLLLHDVIGDWIIPFAANAAAKNANAFEWLRQPLIIVPSPWGSAPHLIHGSLGPPESSSKTASRSVKPFLYGSQMLCYIMPCQRGRKLPKLPLHLGFRHPPEEDWASTLLPTSSLYHLSFNTDWNLNYGLNYKTYVTDYIKTYNHGVLEPIEVLNSQLVCRRASSKTWQPLQYFLPGPRIPSQLHRTLQCTKWKRRIKQNAL